MIEKCSLNEDSFEIVNCISDMVFDEEKREIVLHHGKQKKDQLFMVEKAPI